MTEDASVTWSEEKAIEHSKHTLTSLHCGWADCKVTLNSWQKRFEHLQYHCSDAYYQETGLFHCRYVQCSHNSFAEAQALQVHVETIHASPLPCPIAGCSLTFTHTQWLLDHLRNTHFTLTSSGPSNLPNLSVSSHPQAHPLPLDPPSFPATLSAPIPTWVVITPPVKPHPDCKPTPSQPLSTKHTRVWRHLEHISEVPDEEDEEDETPIHLELPPINADDALKEPFTKFIVQRKIPLDADTALSGPVVLPSVSGQLPKIPILEPTMGYKVFKKKYTQLEIAGLLDGSGIWLQDEEENYMDPEF